MPTETQKQHCTDCRDKPREERGSGPCLSCGKPTRGFDSRVYYGVHGPFCCVPCRNRWVDADIAKAKAASNPGQLTSVLAILAMVVGISCGGVLPGAVEQEGCETVNELADGTVCLVCAGVSYARISGGTDGWCDYDGRICACHGHGLGNQCEQLVAEFAEACR